MAFRRARIEEFRKYLAQVTNETARVGRIVSDLLAFSRRSKPQRAPADLNKHRHAPRSRSSQHKLKLSNVEVETALCEDLPAAPCDPSQIQQVVLNLLLNAAEATQTRERAQASPSPLPPWTASCMATVTDNGEGIAPENLAKIFDPFFTTKPEGKGVGLGLAVSYGIIQAHGGDIEVKSQVGEGTTFTVSLPRGQQASAGMRYLVRGRNAGGRSGSASRSDELAAGRLSEPVPLRWTCRRIDFAYDAAPQPVRLRSRCSRCSSGSARRTRASCWRSPSAISSSRC